MPVLTFGLLEDLTLKLSLSIIFYQTQNVYEIGLIEKNATETNIIAKKEMHKTTIKKCIRLKLGSFSTLRSEVKVWMPEF